MECVPFGNFRHTRQARSVKASSYLESSSVKAIAAAKTAGYVVEVSDGWTDLYATHCTGFESETRAGELNQ
jgi:hypothetical protein